MTQKSQLLNQIRAEDFALYDTALYLNNHPSSKEALCYYKARKENVAALKKQYENTFGPLTIDTNADNNCWRWVEGPWPWEKEAN